MPPLPPAADRQVLSSGSGTAALAISGSRIEILKNRPDFLRVASARRQGTAGFLLQARRRGEAEPPAPLVRVGFTCSKKIGNAVTRNRAKRRLRALMRELMPDLAKPGWDYVLVGRPNATVSRDFADLKRDLTEAMTRIHAPRAEGSGQGPHRERTRRSGAKTQNQGQPQSGPAPAR